jgi:hypothetical protein
MILALCGNNILIVGASLTSPFSFAAISLSPVHARTRLYVFPSYVGCFDEKTSYDRGCVCSVSYWHSVQKRQYILIGFCESFSLLSCSKAFNSGVSSRAADIILEWLCIGHV